MTLYMRKTGRHAESEQYNKELKKKKPRKNWKTPPLLDIHKHPPWTLPV